MKKIKFGLLLGMSILYAHASYAMEWGVSVHEPIPHLAACKSGVASECASDIPGVLTIWLDPGMIAATGLDYMAQKKHSGTTIDASQAIQELEESLKSGCSKGDNASSDETTLEAQTVTAYAPEVVLTSIELAGKDTKKDAELFNNVRANAQEYLFENAAMDGDCDVQGDERSKNCAVKRQSGWLLTSLAMASATSDKVLANSGKEKLKAHFQKLADQFNQQKSPKAMYGIVGAIVLDTHTQMNEANALLARDLEAQSLRTVYESGSVLQSQQ